MDKMSKTHLIYGKNRKKMECVIGGYTKCTKLLEIICLIKA